MQIWAVMQENNMFLTSRPFFYLFNFARLLRMYAIRSPASGRWLMMNACKDTAVYRIDFPSSYA